MLVMVLSSGFIFSGCGSGSDTSSNSGTQQDNSGPAYKDISAEELKSLRETNKNLIVVDVREKSEYDDGHLDNSLLIPTSEFAGRISELPTDKAIVLVCATGARSAWAAGNLAERGYKEVYNLSGGISSWPDELVK